MTLDDLGSIMNDSSSAAISEEAVTTDPSRSNDCNSKVDEHDVFESDKISLVSVVYTGSETWVTDFDKLNSSRMIMEKLASIDILPLTNPSLDNVCAGKDPTDGKWYRVKISALEPAYVVHYLDFGNVSEINVENLGVLPDDLKMDPLAKKVTLKWDNLCVSELVPGVGDVLEVKYDGKEADGTVKLEVLGVKGICDPDENVSDDGKSDEVYDLGGHPEGATLEAGNEEAPDLEAENGLGVEEALGNLAVSPEKIEELEAASTMRDAAHSTVQEILKKLDEELPCSQEEVAKLTRQEVENTIRAMGGPIEAGGAGEGSGDDHLPLQQEVALQTRLQVQKIMEGLDERLQKQQEAALASMRQMMEKALAQSLNKIDRIQKDLHKLYATSKQQQRNRTGQQGGTSEGERTAAPGPGPANVNVNAVEVAYQRNQYNRPVTRHLNANAPGHDFSPDKRQHFKFGHVMDNGAPPPPSQPLIGHPPPRMEMRDGRAMPYVPTDPATNPNIRRPVSMRLKQAGDFNVVTTSILSVTNLPEIFTCDYLCTLFGLYGNVSRAKMLFNQKGKALVEMADAAQAAAAIRILDGAVLFGQTLHVRPSTFDKLIIYTMELTNNTAKDYTRLNSHQANAIRRFKKGFWDADRLVPPSEVLRVSNILNDVEEERLQSVFVQKGYQFKSIRFFRGQGEKKSALLVFGSTDQAFRALHELHNTELSDWMPMKVSFGVMKKE